LKGKINRFLHLFRYRDFVVVINADKKKTDGKKLTDKDILSLFGYPEDEVNNPERAFFKKNTEEVIRKAVGECCRKTAGKANAKQ
jgi:ribosomal protein L13